MTEFAVSVVGEIYVDHVMSGFPAFPAPGIEVVTDNYTREIGGGAAITACGLGRLGRAVNLIGVVGEDDAAWIERRLATCGVSAAGLVRGSGATGVSLSVSTREDRSFFTHAGVNRQLPARLLDDAIIAKLTRTEHVHFAMPLDRAVAARILPTLHAAGCTTSLDVGYQPHWLRSADNHLTCQTVDYLMPNESEAALLCGSESPEDYLAFARRLEMPSALVKLGARGALYAEDGEDLGVMPPRVDAVDSTGSGDAFDAGFIDALLAGADMRHRLRCACICGALSTRAPGAIAGLPRATELREVYEQTYGP